MDSPFYFRVYFSNLDLEIVHVTSVEQIIRIDRNQVCCDHLVHSSAVKFAYIDNHCCIISSFSLRTDPSVS